MRKTQVEEIVAQRNQSEMPFKVTNIDNVVISIKQARQNELIFPAFVFWYLKQSS